MLQDLVKEASGGILHLVCLDSDGQSRLGSGTGFICNGKLVTNHHVMNIGVDRRLWIRRADNADPRGGLTMTSTEWFDRIVTSSDENSYDYAVMDCPEVLAWPGIYDFSLSDQTEIGTQVAFFGFPLEHDNLSIHSGFVSSLYKKRSTLILQLDASVNAGNSGGPLIDLETKKVIGIVTRKATGLSEKFNALRGVLGSNIIALEQQNRKFRILGLNPFEAFAASQYQLMELAGEIERQSNVGIGYAFSATHLMDTGLF